MRKRIATVLVGLAAAAALTLASAAPAAAGNTWPGADLHGVIDIDGAGTNSDLGCC
ncbi:hypothetical protein LO763_04145 [Glycomyces sp. A-F 0318]|uniref:hypothetical protein n=1 Tax=Glycomyces amatae TaxID=2881355 RepID=UPI001E426AD6|nr:hypothetical protein [Glycomyces amatae]MCD0442814.1 hypothetical protein [Glycomyces amatae]